MTHLGQIRAALVAALHTVPGIGQVHDRDRYAVQEKKFLALFQTGAKVAGWVVRRIKTAESSPAIGRRIVTHTWELRGYRGFEDDDASELDFDDLIESLREAVLADETLNGTVATCTVDDQAGAALVDYQPVMFCGVLVHRAVMTLRTLHYL